MRKDDERVITEDLQNLSAGGEKGDDLIRVLRDLTSVQRKIADLQVELQGRKEDKNVAHLTHVSEMEKKIETLARITAILKDVIQNKDRIIARLQQPYSLDCIPVEAEYQKQFSELLMKAASDYGLLTSSVADFQWTQNFKEPPSVWGEMLRPIPVALASCTRFFEAMTAMRESFATLQKLRLGPTDSQLKVPAGRSDCVTPPPWGKESSLDDLAFTSSKEDNNSSDLDGMSNRRLSWPLGKANGTTHERSLLKNKLNSMLDLRSEGEVFHDVQECHDTDHGHHENISNVIGEQTEILQDQMSTIDKAIQYRDILLLFRFNDHDLPFELQEVIMFDLRLLTLFEAGLPSWIWLNRTSKQQLAAVAGIRRRFRRLAVIPAATVVSHTAFIPANHGVFRDPSTHLPLVYPYGRVSLLVHLDSDDILLGSITTIFWLICDILYAPIGLVVGLSNLMGFVFNQMCDIIGDIWLFVSGLLKLVSAAESTVDNNDSTRFRAVGSILRGFVAFFTACNRHQLR
ncbi:hypothetical protein E3N88_05322 [Mikania micrantha]|uniref:Uncharacterized protein n=1 Tax=Mikania micrantha TaxID=192012 RepID=A0A5N6PLB5_9ASTR|nr:hypothetical protein E3N88_05322 [Mikania micrantha]